MDLLEGKTVNGASVLAIRGEEKVHKLVENCWKNTLMKIGKPS
ncbi:hypothetical protein JOC55_006110 [Paenibacillus sacheonensis]|nr:hypothetical protein [Paenibacillus sacheonensis]